MGCQGQLNKPSRRSTLALLGAAAFGHRIQSSWGQTSPSVLRVAIISRTVFYAPLWAALSLKLFEREGLHVTVLVFDNAERITEALLKGEIDIAVSTPESVMVDAYQGGPLRIVAARLLLCQHCWRSMLPLPQQKSLRMLPLLLRQRVQVPALLSLQRLAAAACQTCRQCP